VYGTSPSRPTPDGDGLTDPIELTSGTNPVDADSDDDGLVDGEDVEFHPERAAGTARGRLQAAG
jgi:hypothetical protein